MNKYEIEIVSDGNEKRLTLYRQIIQFEFSPT